MKRLLAHVRKINGMGGYLFEDWELCVVIGTCIREDA